MEDNQSEHTVSVISSYFSLSAAGQRANRRQISMQHTFTAITGDKHVTVNVFTVSTTKIS